MSLEKARILQLKIDAERARYEEIRQEMLHLNQFREQKEIDRCVKLLTESNAIMAEFRLTYSKLMKELVN